MAQKLVQFDAMKILLTGAAGFIGSAIAERLLAEGHEVVACVRDQRSLPGRDGLSVHQVDLSRILSIEDWLALLEDIDAIVNAAGILREPRSGDFERIHFQAPMALAQACTKKGIRRFVQISALGHADDGEFVDSKHRFDQALMSLPSMEAIVLRPSVVVSLRGSYGGSSMLRAMAALPGMAVLPGDGNQKIQPVWLEDLAAMVSQAISLEPATSRILDAVGPEEITLREYLLATRRWLGFSKPRIVIKAPMALVNAVNLAGDWLPAGPLGRTMGRMLVRGNVSDGSTELAADHLAMQTRSVITGLNRSASFVQDRWQAQLYLLAPLAWLSLIVIWLLSALSGFMAESEAYRPILERMGVAETFQHPLVMATSILNLLLAGALVLRRWIQAVLMLMLLSVLAYTLGLGLLAPEQWLDLTGGLVKNLGLIVLILMVMVLENRR